MFNNTTHKGNQHSINRESNPNTQPKEYDYRGVNANKIESFLRNKVMWPIINHTVKNTNIIDAFILSSSYYYTYSRIVLICVCYIISIVMVVIQYYYGAGYCIAFNIIFLMMDIEKAPTRFKTIKRTLRLCILIWFFFPVHIKLLECLTYYYCLIFYHIYKYAVVKRIWIFVYASWVLLFKRQYINDIFVIRYVLFTFGMKFMEIYPLFLSPISRIFVTFCFLIVVHMYHLLRFCYACFINYNIMMGLYELFISFFGLIMVVLQIIISIAVALKSYIDSPVIILLFIILYDKKSRWVVLFNFYRIVMVIISFFDVKNSDLICLQCIPCIRLCLILLEGRCIKIRKWYQMPFDVILQMVINTLLGINRIAVRNRYTLRHENRVYFILSFEMHNQHKFEKFKKSICHLPINVDALMKVNTFNKLHEKPATLQINKTRTTIHTACHDVCNSMVNKWNELCGRMNRRMALLVKGSAVINVVANPLQKLWGPLGDFDCNIIWENRPDHNGVNGIKRIFNRFLLRTFNHLPKTMTIQNEEMDVNDEMQLLSPVYYIKSQTKSLWKSERNYRYKNKTKHFVGLNLCETSKIIVVMMKVLKPSRRIIKAYTIGIYIQELVSLPFNYYSYENLSTPTDTAYDQINDINAVMEEYSKHQPIDKRQARMWNLFNLLRVKAVYIESMTGNKVYPEILDMSIPQITSSKYIDWEKFNEYKNEYYHKIGSIYYNNLKKTMLDCAQFLMGIGNISNERMEKSVKRIKLIKKYENNIV